MKIKKYISTVQVITNWMTCNFGMDYLHYQQIKNMFIAHAHSMWAIKRYDNSTRPMSFYWLTWPDDPHHQPCGEQKCFKQISLRLNWMKIMSTCVDDQRDAQFLWIVFIFHRFFLLYMFRRNYSFQTCRARKNDVI